MRRSIEQEETSKHVMAFSAAAMFGGAAFVVLIESLTPSEPNIAQWPGLAALVLAALLLAFGPRLPFWALATLGPIGVTLIGYGLATTSGAGDGEVLYLWPVIWIAFFFGSWGTVLIVLWTAVVQAIVLFSFPAEASYVDRWMVVVISVGVVATVIGVLAQHNEELLARLETEARMDKLTGLLNRRGFEEKLEIELDRARRYGASVAALSFDIDSFKRINDEWGHEAGDKVLARAGQVLRDQTRSIDIVARVGGDEFIALLPNCEPDTAEGFAERICSEFASTNTPGIPIARMSAGVVVEVAPSDSDELLRNVDAALYMAKNAGRDQTVALSPHVVV